MDEASRALADALTTAAAEQGHALCVNEARPPEGSIVVTLGIVREGLLGMIRQGLPSEGGLRILNHPDVALTKGRLPTATMGWIRTWVAELTRVRRHEAALTAAGLPPHGLLAGTTRVGAVAARLAGARGTSLREALADVEWRKEATGFEAEPDPDDRGRVTLLVDRLGVRDLDLGGDASIRVTEGDPAGDGATVIRIATDARLPETALAAAPGRDVADLVGLPGPPGPTGWPVLSATHGLDIDGTPILEIRCRAPTTTLD